MEEHRKLAGYSCQSCTDPDKINEKWVACDECKLWEHFRCAGVDDTVRDKGYLCKQCKLKKTSRHLTVVPSDKRSLRSSAAKSSLKQVNKVTQLATAFSRGAPSTTSSTRAARLQAQLELVEEEQVLKEQELEACEAMRKKEMEEEERRLEEKKAIIEEEAQLRQRKLQAEKEFQRKQQIIRKESLEKKHSLSRQLSECGSRGGSISDSQERVSNWLQQCNPKQLEDQKDTSMIVSKYATPLNKTMPPLPAEDQRQAADRQSNFQNTMHPETKAAARFNTP